MPARPPALERWHQFVDTRSPEVLLGLLSKDITFRSPAVHQPQRGPETTASYLRAAMTVIGPTIEYQREWIDDRSAVLEFTATIEGLDVHGIDLLAWDEHDQLTEFTVMVRPRSALQVLVDHMGEALLEAHR